jgi:hypothetical protein
MSEKDLAIGVTTMPPVGVISRKPSYLITLDGKTQKRFVTLDKPEIQNGFVQAKGIYSEESEDDIVQKYADLLTSSPKELILEMMFPLAKIVSIRSLVFKAK